MTWCEIPGAWLGWEVLERYGCRLASGLGLTLQLVAISVVIGFLLGLALALLRVAGPRPVRWLVTGYTTVFRGTPLLGQLFLIYYGLGAFRLFWESVSLWWLFREPFYCCLLAFTANTAAYQAEIIRGSLLSLPAGQKEAAQALGIKPFATYYRVLMPQALITALRPLGNELIVMIKASSLASLVTLYDLMGATKMAFARSFDLWIYIVAALIYLLLVEIVRRIWDAAELRLTRHLVLH